MTQEQEDALLDLAELDEEYTLEVVETVREPGDLNGETHQMVTFEGGMGMSIRLENGAAPLKGGETLRLFGKGFGYGVRGAAVEDPGQITRVLYYRTAQQEEAATQEYLQKRADEKRADYAANLSDTRERIAKLPAEFQDRLRRFEEYGGEGWMIDNIPYELFVCEQAVLLANSGIEDFKAFYDLPWEEQKERVPDLDEGHSGNTFGAALRLANVFTNKPQFVPFEHAAIHSLLGCEKAGCWVARKEKTGEQLPA